MVKSKKVRLNRQVLIAIDIGNSSLTYGVFKRSQHLDTGSVDLSHIPYRINSLISKWRKYRNPIVIICSVVPHLTHKLLKLIAQRISPYKVYLVGRNLKVPIRSRYKRGLLGADRLVNVYGAIHKYGTPCLVIDFGTAITFDYVSKLGIFEGGLIVPGLETSWRALKERAALLPKKLDMKPMQGFVGKNTSSGMRLGLFQGYGALSDGLVERFRKASSRKLTVIATGGHSEVIRPFTKKIDAFDPCHTIRSLALIYRNEIMEK